METKTCKSCLLELPATYSKLGTNGAKLYIDDKGRLWKGSTCGDCQAKRRKEQRATKLPKALESSTSNDSDQS